MWARGRGRADASTDAKNGGRHVPTLLSLPRRCLPGPRRPTARRRRYRSMRARRRAGVREGPRGGEVGLLLLPHSPGRQRPKGTCTDEDPTGQVRDLEGRVPRPRCTSGRAQGDTKPARKNGAAAKGEKAEPTDSAGPLSDKALAFLTDRQRIRLGQVIFQLRKMEIFYYPEVAKFLELTAEQTKEAAAIRRWTADEAKKLRTLFLQKRKTSREVQKGVVSLLEKGRTGSSRPLAPSSSGTRVSPRQGDLLRPDRSELRGATEQSHKGCDGGRPGRGIAAR